MALPLPRPHPTPASPHLGLVERSQQLLVVKQRGGRLRELLQDGVVHGFEGLLVAHDARRQAGSLLVQVLSFHLQDVAGGAGFCEIDVSM